MALKWRQAGKQKVSESDSVFHLILYLIKRFLKSLLYTVEAKSVSTKECNRSQTPKVACHPKNWVYPPLEIRSKAPVPFLSFHKVIDIAARKRRRRTYTSIPFSFK